MASKRSKTADPPNSDIEEAKPLRIVAIDSVVAALPGLTFNLSSLGWKAFQDLCGSVLRQVLQQVIVPFPEGPDAGRDLAFEGHGWSQNPTDARRSFVVQCKFRQTPGTLGLSVVKPELPKIRRLHAQGRCDTYVLMTNGRVTADSEQEIRRLVLEAGPSECVVLGGDYIDAAIRENPPLRALVPRVYGLGDLSQILDQRAYAQAAALLAASHEALSKFVVTQPYQKAIEALNRHGFVLLLGPPAAGKSMIASSLAMSALDQWRCPTVKADSPDLFISHWNPHEPGQFFWIDDAFGTTQYQLRLADQWNRVLPQLRAAIERRTRVVMTSRDYIWKAAREDLKLSDFEPLESSQVIVDVRALSLDDRRQILYNHVKYGDQSQSFRRRVKPLLEGACRVEPFLPEVARRFGDQRFTQHLALDSWSVRFFFSHPVEHLRDVVRSLTSDGRAALALIFVSGGLPEGPPRANVRPN
jgi:hypothetical protein